MNQIEQVQQTQSNPLGLGLLYEWQPGDTFALIALKYRREYKDYKELLLLNKIQLSRNNYRMVAGDIIDIPPSWLPLPTVSYDTTFKGSHGYRR